MAVLRTHLEVETCIIKVLYTLMKDSPVIGQMLRIPEYAVKIILAVYSWKRVQGLIKETLLFTI